MFSSTGELFIYIVAGLGIIVVTSIFIFSRKSLCDKRKKAVHLQGDDAGLSFSGGGSHAQSSQAITPSLCGDGSFPQPLQSPSKTAGNWPPPPVYFPSMSESQLRALIGSLSASSGQFRSPVQTHTQHQYH